MTNDAQSTKHIFVWDWVAIRAVLGWNVIYNK